MHPYFFDPPAKVERDHPGADHPIIRRNQPQVLDFRPTLQVPHFVPEEKHHPPPAQKATSQRKGGLIGLFKRRFTPAPAI